MRVHPSEGRRARVAVAESTKLKRRVGCMTTMRAWGSGEVENLGTRRG